MQPDEVDQGPAGLTGAIRALGRRSGAESVRRESAESATSRPRCPSLSNTGFRTLARFPTVPNTTHNQVRRSGSTAPTPEVRASLDAEPVGRQIRWAAEDVKQMTELEGVIDVQQSWVAKLPIERARVHPQLRRDMATIHGRWPYFSNSTRSRSPFRQCRIVPVSTGVMPGPAESTSFRCSSTKRTVVLFTMLLLRVVVNCARTS